MIFGGKISENAQRDCFFMKIPTSTFYLRVKKITFIVSHTGNKKARVLSGRPVIIQRDVASRTESQKFNNFPKFKSVVC